jgi:hypothetical protein
MGRPTERLKQLCTTTAYLNSFMLHFGGGDLNDMPLVDQFVRSWRDLRLEATQGISGPRDKIVAA